MRWESASKANEDRAAIQRPPRDEGAADLDRRLGSGSGKRSALVAGLPVGRRGASNPNRQLLRPEVVAGWPLCLHWPCWRIPTACHSTATRRVLTANPCGRI